MAAPGRRARTPRTPRTVPNLTARLQDAGVERSITITGKTQPGVA